MTYTVSDVNAWYQRAQFRDGPTATVDSYVALLNAGAMDASTVQTAIINDSFTQTCVNPVIRMYQAAFNRLPDEEGERFYVNALASGRITTQEMAGYFANSKEFKDIYGVSASDPINPTTLTQLYQHVLQRTPDLDGYVFWLNSGQTTGQLLNAFSQSSEFQSQTSTSVQHYHEAQLNLAMPTGDFTLLDFKDAIPPDQPVVTPPPVTPPPVTPPSDTTPPTLVSTSPTDNAIGVDLNSPIILTFNEPVAAGTGSILISSGSDVRTINIRDTSQVSISGNTVTIHLPSELNSVLSYNVQMDSGVITDVAGNPFSGITNKQTFNFFTVDTFTPTVNPPQTPSILNFSASGPNSLSVTSSTTGSAALYSGADQIGSMTSITASNMPYALSVVAQASVTTANLTVLSSDGLWATSQTNVILGTDMADIPLTGSASTDFIFGFGDDDSISAGSGADIVYGGSGNDTIFGGIGTDELHGEAGNDLFTYKVGGAELTNDTLNGGSDHDTIEAVSIFSDTGINLTDASFQHVTNMEAIQLSTAGQDIELTLGSNASTAFQNGVSVTVSAGVSGNATIDGSAYTHTMVVTGADGNDSLTGGSGGDTLSGDNGNDTLTGGTGNDTMTGGAGANTFNVDSDTDTITDLKAGDILNVSANAYAYVSLLDLSTATVSNAGSIWITDASGGDDLIVGSSGLDYIDAGAGNDTIIGGSSGPDGSSGDSIWVSSGTNTVIFNAVVGTSSDSNNSVKDTLNDISVSDFIQINATSVSDFSVSSNVWATGPYYVADLNNNGNMADVGDVVAIVYGTLFTAGSETINAVDQTVVNLTGTVGDDTLSGGRNEDTLSGGSGNDQLTGGSGNDVFNYTSTSEFGDTITDYQNGDVLNLSSVAAFGGFTIQTVNAIGAGVYNANNVFIIVNGGTETDISTVGTQIAADNDVTATYGLIVLDEDTSHNVELWYSDNLGNDGVKTLVTTLLGVDITNTTFTLT